MPPERVPRLATARVGPYDRPGGDNKNFLIDEDENATKDDSELEALKNELEALKNNKALLDFENATEEVYNFGDGFKFPVVRRPKVKKRKIKRKKTTAEKKVVKDRKKKVFFPFFKLPLEVRNIIYEYVGCKPCGIAIFTNSGLPAHCKLGYEYDGVITQRRREKYRRSTTSTIKPLYFSSYDWRQLQKKRLMTIEYCETLDATREQLEKIKAGTWEQAGPSEYFEYHGNYYYGGNQYAQGEQYDGDNSDIGNEHPEFFDELTNMDPTWKLNGLSIDNQDVMWANNRGMVNGKARWEITYVRRCEIDGLDGLAWMSLNKQFHEEASKIFFNKNKFIFRSTSEVVGRSEPEDLRVEFLKGRHAAEILFPEANIQGFPGLNSMAEEMVPEESKGFKRMMFGKEYGPKLFNFLYGADATKFARMIGERKFGLLRSIKVEGDLGLRRDDPPEQLPQSEFSNHGRRGRMIDLPAFLPLFVHLVQVACPELQSLTLHASRYWRSYSRETDDKDWEGDPTNASVGCNRHEQVRNIVEKIVAGLPNLKELRLGDYKPFHVPWSDMDVSHFYIPTQATGRKNFHAEYSAEDGGPWLGDGGGEPDEWEGALHLVDLVKEQAKYREAKDKGPRFPKEKKIESSSESTIETLS